MHLVFPGILHLLRFTTALLRQILVETTRKSKLSGTLHFSKQLQEKNIFGYNFQHQFPNQRLIKLVDLDYLNINCSRKSTANNSLLELGEQIVITHKIILYNVHLSKVGHQGGKEKGLSCHVFTTYH